MMTSWFVAAVLFGVVAVAIALGAWRTWHERFDDDNAERRARKLVMLGVAFLVVAIGAAVMGLVSRRTSLPPQPAESVRPVSGRAFVSLPIGNLIKTSYPRRSTGSVSRNSSIALVFTEPLDSATLLDAQQAVRPAAFTLRRVDTGGRISLAGRLSKDKTVAVFTPKDLLGTPERPTAYEAIVGTGLRTVTNTVVASPAFSWQFTVGTLEDRTPMRLLSRFPEQGARVAKNAMAQLVFSKPLDPLSVLDREEFRLGNRASVAVSDDFKIVELRGTTACGTNSCGAKIFCMPFGETPLVSVKELRDLSGNRLQIPLDLSWRSTDTFERTAPVVLSVRPKVNSSNVPADAPVELTFFTLMSATVAEDPVAVLPSEWAETSWTREGSRSTLSLAHAPFAGSLIPILAQLTSDAQSLYQQCFSPCIGP